MARVETVKVVRKDSDKGYRIINASDFDPKTHAPFETAAPKKKRGRPRKNTEAK